MDFFNLELQCTELQILKKKEEIFVLNLPDGIKVGMAGIRCVRNILPLSNSAS